MPSWVSRQLARLGLARKPDPSPRRDSAWRQRFAELKARYDAAVTNDDNRRHWANADGLSAADANSPDVRYTLRTRSRFEADNNGYYSGIIRTRADDLVGAGPTLQVPIDNDEAASAIEQAFSNWARTVRLAEKLHTMDMARLKDGEAFLVMVNNPGLPGPIKLDLALVEADRVTDPTFSFEPTPGDGITYDAFGNPTSYTVLREYPNTSFGFSGKIEKDVYRAEFVCHWFRRDRPGQLRGVPELVSSLPLFAVARRWTLATVLAAETAANFSVMLETEASPDSETTEPTPFEVLDIEANTMTALPIGVKANQMAAEHPNAQYQDFKWELLAECARPVRMPVNVAAGDTSRSNFSSAKIDHLAYRAGIRVDRAFCEAQALDRIYEMWAREAMAIPGLLPDGADPMQLPHKWYWPGWVSWDKADAQQDTEMLNNGTATLAEINAEWGVDWRDVIRQRGKELQFMREAGVIQNAPASSDPADTPTDATAKLAHRFNGHLNGHRNGNGKGAH